MRITQNTLLLAALALINVHLEAQSFKVLVLNAVNGKPRSNMQVDYYCSDATRSYLADEIEDDTDDEGVVIVPYQCKGKDARIHISVGDDPAARSPWEQCGGSAVTATIEEISSEGIVHAPDAAGQMQCTTKISRKLKPVPGQVTIFVKKPSWMQSHF